MGHRASCSSQPPSNFLCFSYCCPPDFALLSLCSTPLSSLLLLLVFLCSQTALLCSPVAVLLNFLCSQTALLYSSVAIFRIFLSSPAVVLLNFSLLFSLELLSSAAILISLETALLSNCSPLLLIVILIFLCSQTALLLSFWFSLALKTALLCSVVLSSNFPLLSRLFSCMDFLFQPALLWPPPNFSLLSLLLMLLLMILICSPFAQTVLLCSIAVLLIYSALLCSSVAVLLISLLFLSSDFFSASNCSLLLCYCCPSWFFSNCSPLLFCCCPVFPLLWNCSPLLSCPSEFLCSQTALLCVLFDRLGHRTSCISWSHMCRYCHCAFFCSSCAFHCLFYECNCQIAIIKLWFITLRCNYYCLCLFARTKALLLSFCSIFVV